MVVLLIFAVLGPLVSFQDSDAKLVPLAAVAVACRKLELPFRLWALPAFTTGTVLPAAAALTTTVTVDETDCPRLFTVVKVKTYVPATRPETAVDNDPEDLLIVAVLGPLASFQVSVDKVVPVAAVAVPVSVDELPVTVWALPALTTGAVAELAVKGLTTTSTEPLADCPLLFVAVNLKT